MQKYLQKNTRLPKGFQVSGIKANIKYQDRLDLALIYSKKACICAGTFTQNKVQAACISHTKANIHNKIHALMINSGYANACTGIQGKENCTTCAKELAKELKIQPKNILLSSTGVIGEQLPLHKIIKALPQLNHTKGKQKKNQEEASKAIMTTDTHPKTYGLSFHTTQTQQDSLQPIKIWGMAKGSGMIHPNMATMLGFILTDVAINQELLQEALKKSVQKSFNQISVDGDTSTNDMVIVLANGKAKNKKITEKNKDFRIFQKALEQVCKKLAQKIAKDGEGATRLIEVCVKNANSKLQAQTLSKAVISSSLVKAAIFGKDANWGRIICAMGYSGTDFDLTKLDLSLISKHGKITIMQQGASKAFDEKQAQNILEAKKIRIQINLHDGKHRAKAWGCDLSYDYVKINADYRS